MSELKPCPFCGGESRLLHNAKRKIYGKDEYRIGVVACCNVCEARMFYGSENLATEAWNRRATIEPERKEKWIPCVDGNEPKANAKCWISTNAKYVRRASYVTKADKWPNGFIVTDGSFGFYEYGKSAKAWMPYVQEPEPYREEGD